VAFFECAWCGEKLTERHHIVEFSKGGEHTVDNLILLCPNCHTQVHKDEINLDELIKRKSTHVKDDRLSGGVQFSLAEPNLKLGNAQFRRVPILLKYKEEPIIELIKKNGEFFLTTRFYNNVGELIFWMSSNRYWTNSNFTVMSKKEELVITSDEIENNKLRIWQDAGFLSIEGSNYIKGMVLSFTPTLIRIGNNTIFSLSATDCQVGILIE
jgi:hypothetical protein